jgi:ornithine decarboxylase
MNDNIIHLAPLKQVIERLNLTWSIINSPIFLAALDHLTESEAHDMREVFLRFPAFLDDSISNPRLGSIFDRSSSDPLNSMLATIAKAYGVAESIAGMTGTTGLNVPAVMTIAGEGESIGVARDCHVSVIGGLCLSGSEPVYLAPPFDADFGVLLPPTRAEVAAMLDAYPNIHGIVITMPTYHGLMGDIQGIVDECHRRDVSVMVDAAHGPHFHFLRDIGFPLAAEDAGADMVTQSTHKVLSALNQGSLLHFNNAKLLPRYEELQATGFQSTSFSYVILLSILHAVEQMVTDGKKTWAAAAKLADRFRDGASKIHGIRVLGETVVDGLRVTGLDPTRVTLNVRGTGLSGYEISDRLLDYGLIVEMATPDVVLFLVSPSRTEGDIDGTLEALSNALAGRASFSSVTRVFEPPALPVRVLTPRQAAFAKRERVPRAEAVGRVIGETIGCYPPGQAIFVAGERITQEGVDYLARAMDAGGHLKRVQDDHFQTVDVVCADWLSRHERGFCPGDTQ